MWNCLLCARPCCALEELTFAPAISQAVPEGPWALTLLAAVHVSFILGSDSWGSARIDFLGGPGASGGLRSPGLHGRIARSWKEDIRESGTHCCWARPFSFLPPCG